MPIHNAHTPTHMCVCVSKSGSSVNKRRVHFPFPPLALGLFSQFSRKRTTQLSACLRCVFGVYQYSTTQPTRKLGHHGCVHPLPRAPFKTMAQTKHHRRQIAKIRQRRFRNEASENDCCWSNEPDDDNSLRCCTQF